MHDDKRRAPDVGTISFFDVHVECAEERTARVTVAGDLDLATADRLFTTLVAAVTRDAVTKVEVDLRRVRLLDAAGIGALLAARNHAMSRGMGFRAWGATGLPLRALEVTGVLGLLGGKT